MGANIKKLSNVVARALNEDATASMLREEIIRATNFAVIVEERSLDDACRDAVDHIATLKRLGRDAPRFRTSALLKMAESSSPNVRRLAAQNLPSGQLYRLMNDAHHAVRSEVAQRIPLRELRTMVRKFPGDDNILTIQRDRLDEADGMLWMSGKKIGDAAKTKDVPLTDAWYENLARIIFNDVGSATLVTSAVPMYNLARQFCQHAKTTSGTLVDADKLIDAIQDLVDAHGERAEDDCFELTVESLSQRARLQEASFTLPGEPTELDELLEGCTRLCESKMAQVERIFSIRKGRPSVATSRVLLREEIELDDELPTNGTMPDECVSEAHERALDLYCEAWNRRWVATGTAARLQWKSFDESIDFEVVR